MARRSQAVLGPLELEVMGVVWERGEVTVSEVLSRLRPRRKLHHNTIMTVMKRLAGKGFLEQYAGGGRAYGYRPRVSREEISRQYLELVRKRFFGGSIQRTIAAFVGSQRLSAAQVARVKRVIEELP